MSRNLEPQMQNVNMMPFIKNDMCNVIQLLRESTQSLLMSWSEDFPKRYCVENWILFFIVSNCRHAWESDNLLSFYFYHYEIWTLEPMQEQQKVNVWQLCNMFWLCRGFECAIRFFEYTIYIIELFYRKLLFLI